MLGATFAAASGATILAIMTVYAIIGGQLGRGPLEPMPSGCSLPNERVLLFYVPLVAWAPLLSLVTYHYYRRRRTSDSRWRSRTDLTLRGKRR